MKCEDCKWWQLAEQRVGAWFELGWCKRNPPTMTIGQCFPDNRWDGDGHPWGRGIFPLTDRDDWCGEFVSKCESPCDKL
jgi:hypothetical protein